MSCSCTGRLICSRVGTEPTLAVIAGASPTVMHFRLEPGSVDKKFYPDRDAIYADLELT